MELGYDFKLTSVSVYVCNPRKLRRDMQSSRISSTSRHLSIGFQIIICIYL